MKKFVSNNPEELKKIAKNLAGNLMSRSRLDIGGGALVLALIGDLGSGKTTFAQNFADILGVKEKVKSPTFIIFRKSKINPPVGGQKSKFEYFYHFDAYRIHNEKEIFNLDWEEIISDPGNIVFVEWADKIEKILPKGCVKINFKHLKGGKREIEITQVHKTV